MSGSSLTRRVVSGLILAPAVFYLVYLGSWPFLIFIEALVILGIDVPDELDESARYTPVDPSNPGSYPALRLSCARRR